MLGTRQYWKRRLPTNHWFLHTKYAGTTATAPALWKVLRPEHHVQITNPHKVSPMLSSKARRDSLASGGWQLLFPGRAREVGVAKSSLFCRCVPVISGKPCSLSHSRRAVTPQRVANIYPCSMGWIEFARFYVYYGISTQLQESLYFIRKQSGI